MTENDFFIMTLLLGGTCLLAAFLGHRTGNDKRDVRLMMGFGAALGGVALLLSPLTWI